MFAALLPSSAVPPHARRSTRTWPGPPPRSRGSSARAEVHPSTDPLASAATRFLRTRGGPPSARSGGVNSTWVPPHARRSTLRIVQVFGSAGGSSARAEVHPTRIYCSSSARGFLRTRGGPPCGSWAPGVNQKVPPHARRSTLTMTTKTLTPWGSSARAEVHPWTTRAWSMAPGFLRTRGGPPRTQSTWGRGGRVPPHARRSTRSTDWRSTDSAGSSARAEVHPLDVELKLPRKRFLRTRGGPPVWVGHCPGDRGVPPHARRSTLRQRCRARHAAGSSARAEVHPAV